MTVPTAIVIETPHSRSNAISAPQAASAPQLPVTKLPVTRSPRRSQPSQRPGDSTAADRGAQLLEPMFVEQPGLGAFVALRAAVLFNLGMAACGLLAYEGWALLMR